MIFIDKRVQDLHLQRVPATANPTLQAWDAADERLIAEAQSKNIAADARILLVNDQFGALSVALAHYNCMVWSDSAMSAEAIKLNCERNDCRVPPFIAATDKPIGQFDLVLLKIPKTHSLLEYQLSILSDGDQLLNGLIAGGMVKHLTSSVFKVFEKYYREVNTSLAQKKSRLVYASEPLPSVSPAKLNREFYCDALAMPISSGPNVYSAERLDAGARLLLSVVSQMPVVQEVVDLGCGNGVLGIAYQQYQPEASVCFVDESYLAIQSTQQNYRRCFDQAPLVFTSNGLPKDRIDVELILCNPPFHQGFVIGDHIAWQMFDECKRSLKEQGELWVVGNRHLNYHQKLKKHFGQVDVVISNAKFIVLRCIKGLS